MCDGSSDRFGIKVDGDVHVEVESEQFINVSEGGVVNSGLVWDEAVQGAAQYLPNCDTTAASNRHDVQQVLLRGDRGHLILFLCFCVSD